MAQIHAARRDEAGSRRDGTTPPGTSHTARTDAAADADGAGHRHDPADASTAGRPDLARAAVDRGSVADWLDTRHPAARATGSWSAVGTTGDHDSAAAGLAIQICAVVAVAAPVDHTERDRCRRVARAALVEDVEWLAETGETHLRAARRVGMTPTSLQRALFRVHRHLWQRLTGPIA